MPETPELSAAKHALLEKYLRGEIHPLPTSEKIATKPTDPDGPAVIATDGAREKVILVQKGSSARKPFFYLHGQWDGKFFFCYPLARELGQDQPFYLLDPYRFEGLPALPTVEVMAAAHIKSMRAIQPEGPYLLGGWCNGGLLAYEMARQLDAAGQKLDLLLLMDPVTLVYPFHQRIFRHTLSSIGKLLHFSRDKQFKQYLWWKQQLKHLYKYMLYPAYRKGHMPRVETAEELREHYPTNYDWLAMDYIPASMYSGFITFFWSEPQVFRPGWREVERKGKVEIYRIPGTHMTSRTDYLPVLAEKLRVTLDKAQAI
jgi:thioesterase domain-containing protein